MTKSLTEDRRVTFVASPAIHGTLLLIEKRKRSSNINRLLEQGMFQSAELRALRLKCSALERQIQAKSRCFICHDEGTYKAHVVVTDESGRRHTRIAAFCTCVSGKLAIDAELSNDISYLVPSIVFEFQNHVDANVAATRLTDIGEITFVNRVSANEWRRCDAHLASAFAFKVNKEEHLTAIPKLFPLGSCGRYVFAFGEKCFPSKRYVETSHANVQLLLKRAGAPGMRHRTSQVEEN
jgi:hypothetical protein